MQQKIENYFCKFEPKINRNKEVKINFVPVYSELPNENGCIHKNALYVVRIILVPTSNKVYFYKVSNNNDICIVEKREDNQNKILEGE